MVENGIETTTNNNTTSSKKNETTTTTNNSGSNSDTLSTLPSNCLPLTHQVAGHFYGKGRTKLGILILSIKLVINQTFYVCPITDKIRIVRILMIEQIIFKIK